MTVEPGRINRLPHDRHGRPVPWFVAWIDGVPDFRIIAPGALRTAIAKRLCWVCGVPFARQEPRAFVVGPMCAVNQRSAEPPSHHDCAVYSALACPFLVTPNMVRRERHLPPGVTDPAGIMIRRNPGVSLVWVARYNTWKIYRPEDGGILFDMGPAAWVEWFARGRTATRAEVMASIDSGLPVLREMARQDGLAATAELAREYEAVMKLVPQ